MKHYIPSALLLLLILALVPASHAHHRRTIDAFAAAYAKKDFAAIRAVFSDAAWEGKDGGVSIEKLQKWLAGSERHYFEGAPGEKRLDKALAMGIKFAAGPEESGSPSWVYIHMKPVETPISVEVGEKTYLCRWQIVRITESIDETEKFLDERPDYLEARAKKKGK